MDSKLDLSVVGYRETGTNDHNIKLDPVDGHPMLKMQGQWTRWETASREIYYDKGAGQIKSRNDPTKFWNYYSDGLVLSNRFEIPHAFPIYRIDSRRI